uniref:Fluoride-specific ion channel FluC n=1 Tax=Thermosporothrix sp. COM3 TaxID=2490863 RepID=A0A455SEG1_9CHLR|nr:putative fluoride ion transporter CrcB [Thermosporothrix sp. COM3]
MLAVFCGGFCGTLARYLVVTVLQAHGWPYDILFANLTGALLFACLTLLADTTDLIGPTRRLVLMTGFCGAYTTFSSLALGDVQLFERGQWLPGLLYLVVSVIGGLLAVYLGSVCGSFLGRRIKRKAIVSGPIIQEEVEQVGEKL